MSDDLSGDMLAPSWPNLVNIGKTFEISLNNLLFSQHMGIVGCYYSAICLILFHRTFCLILGSSG